MYYPEDKVYFRWRQSNNPMYEYEEEGVEQARGFEHISSNINGYHWGGLVRPTLKEKDRINTFLEGNPGINYWYYAIGMLQSVYDRWKEDGIPSYKYEYANLYVSVWIKLPYTMNSLFQCTQKIVSRLNNHIPLISVFFLKS